MTEPVRGPERGGIIADSGLSYRRPDRIVPGKHAVVGKEEEIDSAV